MEKKYNHPEENNNQDKLGEPTIEYGIQQNVEIKMSPPLTEEELKNALTTDELLERVFPRIKKLFE